MLRTGLAKKSEEMEIVFVHVDTILFEFILSESLRHSRSVDFCLVEGSSPFFSLPMRFFVFIYSRFSQ